VVHIDTLNLFWRKEVRELFGVVASDSGMGLNVCFFEFSCGEYDAFESYFESEPVELG